ncbi:Na+/H+ antiporter OS=Streptomyces tendae OX=1932 GN=GUR47_14605 PE=3 SV=1 [Streptomyces tendae]
MPVPVPLLLVAAGLAVSYVPGVPDYTLDPHIVLPLLLPPLLHTAATDSSYLDLRAQARPVALLSVGYVLFATFVVGCAAYLFVPGLPLTAALVLGAVVAPPDAVAATAVARRVGLPSRITTILQGESLVNDATAITAFKVALAAAVGEGATWAGGIGEFLIAAVGGVGVGLVLMVPLHWLRTHLKEALLQNALSLLIPFVAYAVAEQVHASGVLAVVVVALYLGHRAWEVDFATRLQEEAVWKMVAFVLESAVFALIGLQLPVVLKGLGEYEGIDAAWYALAVFLVVAVARFAWVYPATFLPRLSARVRAREGDLSWKGPFVIGWAGMRGVVSLPPSPSPSRSRCTAASPFPSATSSCPHLHDRHRHAGRAGCQPAAADPAAEVPPHDVQAETLAEANAQARPRGPRNGAWTSSWSTSAALPGPLAVRLRTVLDAPQRRLRTRVGQATPSPASPSTTPAGGSTGR